MILPQYLFLSKMPHVQLYLNFKKNNLNKLERLSKLLINVYLNSPPPQNIYQFLKDNLVLRKMLRNGNTKKKKKSFPFRPNLLLFVYKEISAGYSLFQMIFLLRILLTRSAVTFVIIIPSVVQTQFYAAEEQLLTPSHFTKISLLSSASFYFSIYYIFCLLHFIIQFHFQERIMIGYS